MCVAIDPKCKVLKIFLSSNYSYQIIHVLVFSFSALISCEIALVIICRKYPYICWVGLIFSECRYLNNLFLIMWLNGI